MIPGAITMIGITALQDARVRRRSELAEAALNYARAVRRGSDTEERDTLAELDRAGCALGEADQALRLVTTAAREATIGDIVVGEPGGAA